MRRKTAILVIVALLFGVLPSGSFSTRNSTVKAAGNTLAGDAGDAEKEGTGNVTGQEGYGLHNPKTDESGVVTWDCVYFGNYWQMDTNRDGRVDQDDEKQPIKWRVLSVDGDDVFLLAEKDLDCRPYNTEDGDDISWETCTLRSWLNGYGAEENKAGEDYSGKGFLDDAFTSEEKFSIKESAVINDDNLLYGTEGGNNTSDRLYLLSIDESMNPAYGFPSENNETETRKAQTTAYVRRQGVDTLERPGNYGGWWLRSIGFYKGEADNVKNTGLVPWRGLSVHLCFATVRPVLHLNLKASSDAISTPSWSYAGTVTLKGRLDETATPAPADTAKPSGTPIAAPTVNPLGTTSPAESKKPDAESTVKPMATPTPAGTVFPIGSPSPAESKKPDEGSTVKPMVTPTPVGTTFPAGSPSPVESKKPDEGLTAAPTGTSTAAPGTTLSQPDPVLQPTAAPVPVSVGKVSSVGRVSSFKLKQKKRTVTVSWKKVSGADGYQICYSTSKKWKKKTRKLTANMKVEIKKLKKKKTYYFRVRAYRKDGAKKIYGAWSNKRKMKIRK